MARVTVELELPYPPSVNKYWRNVRGVMKINHSGRVYANDVAALVLAEKIPSLSGRLSVVMHAYPPDRRRRDLDNLPKAVLDSLAKAGVYEDDSQIDRLSIYRATVKKGGKLLVRIRELEYGKSPGGG